MENGNGHAADGMLPPRQTVTFRIGGEDLAVPSLSFLDLDGVKEAMRSLTTETHWIDYAGAVLVVVAHQLAATRPELTLDVLRRRCTGGETGQLAAQMNELLWASGFPRPPEAPAESPGTGTLTGFAPGSPPEASAAATRSS